MSEAEIRARRGCAWIHSTAVGVGPLLSREAVASPVVVTNSRGAHSEAIAEHAIALALALRRRLHIAVLRQHARQWAQVEFQARRVLALRDTRCSSSDSARSGRAWRRSARDSACASPAYGAGSTSPCPAGVVGSPPPSGFDDALRDADVVVLALPPTQETRALLGDASSRSCGRRPCS